VDERAVRFVAGPWVGRMDLDRAAETLLPRLDVQGVQPLSVGRPERAGFLFGPGEDVERTRHRVDYRSAKDADLAQDVVGSELNCARRDGGAEVDLPEGEFGVRVIGIEGVDAVMHRSDEDYVARPITWHRQLRDIQRLGVDLAIHRTHVKLTKRLYVDV